MSVDLTDEQIARKVAAWVDGCENTIGPGDAWERAEELGLVINGRMPSGDAEAARAWLIEHGFQPAPTSTRADRQVAAVRQVLRWLENGPLFSTRRKYGEAATVIYQRAAKALRRALEVE